MQKLEEQDRGGLEKVKSLGSKTVMACHMSIVSTVPLEMLAILFGVHDPDRQGRVWITQRYGNFLCFL